MSPRKYEQRTRRIGSANAYRRAHDAVRAQRGLASQYACTECGAQAKDWSLRDDPVADLVCSPNETGHAAWWSPLVTDYTPRCRRCHRRADAALRRERAH